MIAENYLLLNNYGQLSLLKIDYDSFDISFISKYSLDFGSIFTVVDQVKQRDFLMYEDDKFVIGSLIDDKIVFSRPREFDFLYFYYSKLAGKTLSGLRISPCENSMTARLWEYCDIDLNTLEMKTTEVHFPSNDYYNMGCSYVRFLFLYLI
jgi:hypothetical protein